mmetsp:Transcript_37877/g.97754  ORF Transcript_37877/g.97754 Transcript_37877/m.97754 type:complete len:80 (+) Transcript_37877:1496-1735(+)
MSAKMTSSPGKGKQGGQTGRGRTEERRPVIDDVLKVRSVKVPQRPKIPNAPNFQLARKSCHSILLFIFGLSGCSVQCAV